MPALRMQDIAGLTPSIDATRADQLFALAGRNYIFDSIGPKSAFGNRFVSPVPLRNFNHVQGFKVQLDDVDRTFKMTDDGIWEWAETKGNYVLRYAFPTINTTIYRLTWAYLNRVIFFGHPALGLLAYNLRTGIFARAQGPGIPDDVIAIASDNGRLGVLTENALYWSAQSDGFNFEPTLGGAGAQTLAARISGDPIHLTSYAGGFLTWTTGGILRSEFTGGAEVYRHRNIDTEYRPVNSFCVQKISNDTTAILDNRGLFQTRGQAPEPLTPIFNEFLIEYFREARLDEGINARLEWDDRRRLLYLSYSTSYASPIYEDAFVLYPPLDKWGQFNEPHMGILPINLETTSRRGYYFSFVDPEGIHKYWTTAGSRQTKQTGQGLDLFVPSVEKAFHETDGENGVYVLSATQGFHTSAKAPFSMAGYYVNGSTTPANPTLEGLNSFFALGYIKAEQGMTDDMLLEITQIFVRSGQVGKTSQVGNVFNLAAEQGFDYSQPGTLNETDELLNYVTHKVEAIGTLDGNTVFTQALAIPAGFVPGGRQYACSVVGKYMAIKFSADEIGEAFYVRTLDLTTVPAGRLV